MAERSTRLVRLGLDDPGWLEFVAGRADAIPFHHPAWAAFLSECYSMPAFVLAAMGSDGRIAAGLPIIEVAHMRRRRWVSLPYTDRCPALTSADVPAADLAAELAAARSLAGVGSVDLRASLPGAFAHDAGRLHLLTLDSDPARTFDGFHRSRVRPNIRKAERMGVEIVTATREEELTRDFYDLHVATRQRLGVPVQPRKFFSLFWRRLVEPGMATLMLGRVDGKPVAGAVLMSWNGTVMYKFAASDPAFSGHRPVNLVLWHAIRAACLDGAQTFDFGRTDDGNEGLRAFKRSWGAEELPLTYSLLAETAPRAAGSHRAQSVLGAGLRRSPAWVTRMAGELLYRFAA